jgi:hypothetical protein
MPPIQLKRSAIASKVPLTTDLALGEIAINTNDGRLFFKKDPGTPSIVEVETLNGAQTISGTKTFTGGTYFNEVVVRAAGPTEGGQLILAYANNTTATGQVNSTWNIDVQDFTNQNLRFFRVNPSGATDVALTIPDTGGITFNRSIVLGTNGFSANGSVGTAGQVLTSNGSATYWGSAAGGSATNLGNSANSTTVTVTSSTGTSTTLLAANSTIAGVLSAGTQTIGGAKTLNTVTTVDLGASTYTDAIRIKSGTEAAGNPFLYLKKDSATGFVIGGFGTASEGSMNLAFPGHVGINTTPLAWPTNNNYSIIQMKNDAIYSASVGGGLTALNLVQNLYYNGTNWDYVNASTDGAALYQMVGGVHLFATAPSGSTGGLGATTTNAMLIDNNAKVGVGNFGAGGVQAQLHVLASGLGDLVDTVRVTHANAGATYGPTLVIHRDSASPAASDQTGAIVFRGNNSSAGAAQYAYLQSSIVTPTAAAEDGQLSIGVMSAGTPTDILSVTKTGTSTTGSVAATTTVSAGTALLAPTADSVTVPGHSWTGDTSTGLFRKGAGSIGIAISGTEEFNLTAAGMFPLIPTSGYAQVMSEWTFRRTANGAAIGSTIADVFTTPSSLSLEASSVYEITGILYFLKTTAGTALWTNLFSSAPTLFTMESTQTAITGMTAATGGTYTPLSLYFYSQGATTAASAATGSLTTGVNHFFKFRGHIQTNAATNWRLRVTQSAGTMTPLAGSYYSIRKVAASTGTFAA